MMRRMVGFDVVAIYNRTRETAEQAYADAGVENVVHVEDPDRLDEIVSGGGHVTVSDPGVICAANCIEAVMEITGEVEFGATVATDAIRHGKHLVLVNAELDATVGPILKVMADRAGTVITNTDGDEPGVAMNLLRFVTSIGYQPVLAGNLKGFIDTHRNPKTQAGFAREHGQQPKMITSFADGTKLSMESTVLANASGFGVARRGMNGHRCDHVLNVIDHYDPEELLERPLVDYVLGADPGSGAFVVGYDDSPDRSLYMRYFKMGDGPNYVFYRPFHLVHLEAPLSVARAVLFGDATITPAAGPVCEVLATAKRDLAAGEVLDGIGGFTCYGVIDNVAAVRSENLLPMGLADGCRLVRDVRMDRPIGFDDIEVPEGRLIDDLWRQQNEQFN
jgi:predicted homoserine dehydrogenase-like protein